MKESSSILGSPDKHLSKCARIAQVNIGFRQRNDKKGAYESKLVSLSVCQNKNVCLMRLSLSLNTAKLMHFSSVFVYARHEVRRFKLVRT